jgi:hypothetical protein
MTEPTTETKTEPTPQLNSKEKLLAFADAIDALPRPALQSGLAKALAEEADRKLQRASRYIRDYINLI